MSGLAGVLVSVAESVGIDFLDYNLALLVLAFLGLVFLASF